MSVSVIVSHYPELPPLLVKQVNESSEPCGAIVALCCSIAEISVLFCLELLRDPTLKEVVPADGILGLLDVYP